MKRGLHDVNSSISFAKIIQYADDTKLYMNVSSDLEHTKLQLDIDSFAQWCSANKLDLNRRKTKHLSYTRLTNNNNHNFTLNAITIAKEEKIKDLGIIFDNKLTFKEHIATTIVRVNQLIGFIYRRHKELKDKKILLLMYKSLILPIIEYGTIVWSTDTIVDLGLIEHAQRKFTRLILNVPPDPRCNRYLDYQQRLKKLERLQLKDRKNLLRILYITKLINTPENVPSLNNYIARNPTIRNLRKTRSFMLPKYSTALAERCPMTSMQRVFNEHQHLFAISDSIVIIKLKIKQHYLQSTRN